MYLNSTYPQTGEKPISFKKMLPGNKQPLEYFSNVLSHLYFQLPFKSPHRIPGSSKSSRFPEDNLVFSFLFPKCTRSGGCGFHLWKSSALQPHTGELARWCALKNSKAPPAWRKVYKPLVPHHQPPHRHCAPSWCLVVGELGLSAAAFSPLGQGQPPR